MISFGSQFFYKNIISIGETVVGRIRAPGSDQEGRAEGTWRKSNYNDPDMFQIIFDLFWAGRFG